MDLRSQRLSLADIGKDTDNATAMSRLTVSEVFYLWQLAGGDVLAELGKHGLMVTTPPLLSLPSLVTGIK